MRRARSHNKPQYLRIKGLALAESGDTPAAVQLWKRVLAEYPSSLDAWPVREHLGDVARDEGRPDEAQRWYRELLELNPALKATTHMLEVSLAEILIANNNEAERDEAMRLLQSAINRGGLLNDQLFRWHLALIETATQLGDAETQRRAARTALSLVGRGPAFTRHPTVGMVNTDDVTIQRLRDLADGTPQRKKAHHRPWSRRNTHRT